MLCVLSLLHKAGITIYLNNCKFLVEEICFFENMKGPEKLELVDYTTNEGSNMKTPRSVTKLNQFPLSIVVYLQFVPNFAPLTKPRSIKL